MQQQHRDDERLDDEALSTAIGGSGSHGNRGAGPGQGGNGTGGGDGLGWLRNLLRELFKK